MSNLYKASISAVVIVIFTVGVVGGWWLTKAENEPSDSGIASNDEGGFSGSEVTDSEASSSEATGVQDPTAAPSTSSASESLRGITSNESNNDGSSSEGISEEEASDNTAPKTTPAGNPLGADREARVIELIGRIESDIEDIQGYGEQLDTMMEDYEESWSVVQNSYSELQGLNSEEASSCEAYSTIAETMNTQLNNVLYSSSDVTAFRDNVEDSLESISDHRADIEYHWSLLQDLGFATPNVSRSEIDDVYSASEEVATEVIADFDEAEDRAATIQNNVTEIQSGSEETLRELETECQFAEKFPNDPLPGEPLPGGSTQY